MHHRISCSCFILLFASSAGLFLRAQTSQAAQHDHHMAEVKKHGAEAMGFDQDRTAHHFHLSSEGGVIQVSANDPKDSRSIALVQHHLELQTENFAKGDFAAPEHTHDQMPPGVNDMQKLKSEIHYAFRKTAQGGEVRIASRNPKAVEAIHQFLRFQIKDHATGDDPDVE